jgi:hypothetical protein
MATDRTLRGSRKHVLDWVSSHAFADELTAMLAPTGGQVQPSSAWLPRSQTEPEEARLETFGPRHLPGVIEWPRLSDWWLVHKEGANTPNWDLAAVCAFPQGPGLVLVEAKANDRELKEDAKPLEPEASQRSRENHQRIGAAIREARNSLSQVVPGVAIDRDVSYQLSNRLAFTWKLATMGLPTVLVYLGFLSDSGIDDVGDHFRDHAHWAESFHTHARKVAPDALFEREIKCGSASMWALVRSRRVLQTSPERPKRA